MTFGDNLKKYRENRKLSQQQIADNFGVDLATVMEWENNKTMPSAEKLIELSKFYDVYLEELLGEEKDTGITEYSITQRSNIFFTIAFQTGMLISCAKLFKDGNSWGVVSFIISLILIFFMFHNLKMEKNIKQRIKNIKIESCYLFIQFAVLVIGLISTFNIASVYLSLIIEIIYIFVINPKYMNRPLIAQKKQKQKQ